MEEAAQKRSRVETFSCVICDEAAAKYTCPGCQARTCSLACVQRHKVEVRDRDVGRRGLAVPSSPGDAAQSNCTGKRNRTAYVPLSEFSDAELMSGARALASSPARSA